MKTVAKVRNLQISKILNTDANRVFLIPFKIMFTSRYSFKNCCSKWLIVVIWVNQKFSLTNVFCFFLNWRFFSEIYQKEIINCYEIYVKIPRFLDRSMASIRPMHTNIVLGIWNCVSNNLPCEKNCNTNKVTI